MAMTQGDAAVPFARARTAAARAVAAPRIEPLRPALIPETARMLARAYVANPLHLAAFGRDELARNEAFFREGLAVMAGPKLVALDDAREDGPRVVGFVHWVRSPGCRLHWLEKLRLAPAMIEGFGVRAALRVSRWLSTWAHHDPARPHAHLGPIAVDPDAQGRGIGRRLMELHRAELDRLALAGYLETDRPENVAFYRRFGFETIRELDVLGVPNYTMWRQAPSARAVPDAA